MTSNPLIAPILPLRRVDPPEVPCAGVLVRIADDIWQLVALDRPRFSSVGDARGGVEHVWTPHDYVLHDGLRAAVLPWCREPLGEMLARSDAGALSGGAAVTALVSLIRGLQEAHRLGSGEGPVSATWWITHDGRPLLVPDESSDTVTQTVGLIDVIRARTTDSDLHRIVDAVAETCVRADIDEREWDGLERRLFECYAPQPIPFPFHESSTSSVPVDVPILAAPVSVGAATNGDGWTGRQSPGTRNATTVARGVRTSVRTLPKRMRTRFRRRSRVGRGPASVASDRGPQRKGRRAPLLAGTGVAALVLVLGLTWPTDAGKTGDTRSGDTQISPRTGDGPVPRRSTTHDPAPSGSSVVAPRPSVARSLSPTRSPTVTRSPTPAWSPTPGASGSQRGGRTASSAGVDDAAAGAASQAPADARRTDPVAAVEALLSEGRRCRSAASCEVRLTGRSGTVTIPLPAQVALLDDYGGMAAVRVDSAAHEATVVVELQDEQWRVRDVQNVTDPPRT